MVEAARTNGYRTDDVEEGAERRYAPECYACPIGTISMAVQRAQPEASEHLIRAGRELVLAARGLLDGLAEYLAQMEERSQAARIERIEIRRPRA